MSSPLVVMAAGGTGGHVFPAEALAEELIGRGYRLALLTDRRGGAFSGILGDLETYRIRAGGVAGKKVWAVLRGGCELTIGLFQARSLLRKLSPKAVIGFGGYASLPTMLAASFDGYATAIHEQNAVLGRANRLLSSRVSKIATCFDSVRGVPNTIQHKLVPTGMPVRPAVIKNRGTPYPEILTDQPLKLLVFGGSQGARILSDVVPAAIRSLNDDIRRRLFITQQCRQEDLERVGEAYAEVGVEVNLRSFFRDLPALIADAHLIIGRSGASTIAELTAIGRPAILVPYPHATDDHQSDNAQAIDEAGGGWLINETAFTSGALACRLESLFGLPAVLERGAVNARAVGRPNATIHLADLVNDIISNRDNGTLIKGVKS